MLEFLEFFLNYRHANCCRHENALIDTQEGYCPDCGVYLKKYYYVVRCSHCDLKRYGTIRRGEIVPETHFCENCGGHEFYIERFERVRITDIRHAICIKEPQVDHEDLIDVTQVWADKEEKRKCLANKNQ